MSKDDFLQPIICDDLMGAVTLLVDLDFSGSHDLQQRDIQIRQGSHSSGENPVGTRVFGGKTGLGRGQYFLTVLPE